MFFAILTYKQPLEKVDMYLQSHNLYLEKNYKMGNFIFSGRRNPRTGGVILINLDSKNEVEKIINEDPFFLNNIARYELIDFTPSKYDEKFEKFIK